MRRMGLELTVVSPCLADEDVRLRRRDRDQERRAKEDLEFQARMAGEIRRLFPGTHPGQGSPMIIRLVPPGEH